MNITVDNTDRRLRYGGAGWYTQTNINGDFNRTRTGVSPNWLHTVLTYVEFTFQGSSVAVYGSLDEIGTVGGPQGYSVEFKVDNGPPTIYTPPVATARQHGQLFYTSHLLSDDEHTLNFAITIPFPAGCTFWLDFIQYTPASKIVPDAGSNTETITLANPTAPVSGIQSMTGSNTPSALTVPITTIVSSGGSVPLSIHENSLNNSLESRTENISTQTPPATSSSLPSIPSESAPATGSRPKTPTGVIVGAVIGGIVLLIIVSTLLYCWRRKPRVIISFSPNGGSTMTIIPFLNTDPPVTQGKGESNLFNNDSPPPWSPSESSLSDVQGIAGSIVGSNTLVGHTPRRSFKGRSKNRHRMDGGGA